MDAPRSSSPIPALAARLRAGASVRVVVVGAGRSGLAAARLLRSRGARVTVLDDRELSLHDLATGPFERGPVDESELVVLSPGVPRSRPELRGAIAAGRLVGEIELASWFVSVPLVGITGTNGKSTTTALLGHLLEAAGKRAFVGGNLGTPFSELPLGEQAPEVAVLELSSYQLESIETARFRAAAWLNLQPDHLDRYPSVEAYGAAKARLFDALEPDGVAVAAAGDPAVRAAAARVSARKRWFGLGLAERPGTFVVNAVAHRGEERYRIDGPGLLGSHNHENAAAAIELSRGLGAAPEAVQAGLTTFAGLPHRLALVHEGRGVRWYDDSKATNVASAVTAVRAMTAPTALVAGGRDKGGSWAPLVDACRAGPVRLVLAIGEAAPLVRAAFAGVLPVEEVHTLEGAVRRARAWARPESAVLLAPACASFDQFESYAARGEAFARLARESGEESDR